MTRFLCTGDLHLGAGSDLGNEPGERLAEQEAVLDWIVSQANDLGAALIFAGDAWERRRPTPAEILAFRRPLERLNQPAIVIPGNHDVEAFDRPTGFDVFWSWRDGHELVARPDVWPLADAWVATLPWAPPSRLVAIEGGGDRDEINRKLAGGLVDIARGLFASIEQYDAPKILVAHWSVGGASTPTGVPVELFREPVLDLRALEAIGFDAVVLGHIHKPQMLSIGPLVENEVGSHVTAKPTPIFYVGSPMPLNFGEAESAHVVWLLDVEPGNVQAFQIPVPSRRLVTLAIEGEGALEAISSHDLEDAIGLTPVDDAVVKVKIRANVEQARRLNLAAVKEEILDAGAHKVWSIAVDVEKPELTRGVAIDETVDDVEAFDRWLESIAFDTDAWGDLHDLHGHYLQEVQHGTARS